MNTETQTLPEITLSPVISTQLAAIGHCPATNRLAIQFKSWRADQPGSLYHYSNFTIEDFEAFMAAESKGSYFKKLIKPEVEKHPFVKVS